VLKGIFGIIGSSYNNILTLIMFKNLLCSHNADIDVFIVDQETGHLIVHRKPSFQAVHPNPVVVPDVYDIEFKGGFPGVAANVLLDKIDKTGIYKLRLHFYSDLPRHRRLYCFE